MRNWRQKKTNLVAKPSTFLKNEEVKEDRKERNKETECYNFSYCIKGMQNWMPDFDCEWFSETVLDKP